MASSIRIEKRVAAEDTEKKNFFRTNFLCFYLFFLFAPFEVLVNSVSSGHFKELMKSGHRCNIIHKFGVGDRIVGENLVERTL